MNQDHIKDKLRKLFAVAENDASADGEIENAMRAANILMQQHQIEREDIYEDTDGQVSVSSVSYGQVTRYSMFTAMTAWEHYLCNFVIEFVAGMNYYTECRQVRRNKHGMAVGGDATLITFFGPHDDAVFCGEIFDEIIVFVAAAAKLRYGKALYRGRAASYAEGFGRALWEAYQQEVAKLENVSRSDCTALSVINRSIAIKEGGLDWLKTEHGVKLRSGRQQRSQSYHSSDAYAQGRADGKNYKPGTQKKAGYLT